MTERKQENAQELQDDVLDKAQGGLGDTATHEVGHIISPRDPASGLPTGKIR